MGILEESVWSVPGYRRGRGHDSFPARRGKKETLQLKTANCFIKVITYASDTAKGPMYVREIRNLLTAYLCRPRSLVSPTAPTSHREVTSKIYTVHSRTGSIILPFIGAGSFLGVGPRDGQIDRPRLLRVVRKYLSEKLTMAIQCEFSPG